MRDSDKVKVIEHICVDCLEYTEGEDASFLRGVLTAITSVIDYEERNNGEEK